MCVLVLLCTVRVFLLACPTHRLFCAPAPCTCVPKRAAPVLTRPRRRTRPRARHALWQQRGQQGLLI